MCYDLSYKMLEEHFVHKMYWKILHALFVKFRYISVHHRYINFRYILRIGYEQIAFFSSSIKSLCHELYTENKKLNQF